METQRAPHPDQEFHPNLYDKDSSIETLNKLARHAVDTEFTQSVLSRAPKIVFDMLANYDVSFPEGSTLTPTFFFQEKSKPVIARILNRSFQGMDGSYVWELGLNIVFVGDDPIKTTECFFHEQMHSLGIQLDGETQNRKVLQTGYEYNLASDTNFLTRGSFLEESVVDFLATNMTKQYFSHEGEVLDERKIALVAGGTKYLLFRDVLMSMMRSESPLEQLLIQARFDSQKITSLRTELANTYGIGAAHTLFSLSTDPAAVGITALALRSISTVPRRKMATTHELLTKLPQTYSRESAQQWVNSILALIPVDQVSIDPGSQLRDKKVQLPTIEAQIYTELTTRFGKPGFSKAEEDRLIGNPNITILFLWALGEKYRLGLHYGIEIDTTGVLQYKHW